jgi:hypothetical protein
MASVVGGSDSNGEGTVMDAFEDFVSQAVVWAWLVGRCFHPYWIRVRVSLVVDNLQYRPPQVLMPSLDFQSENLRSLIEQQQRLRVVCAPPV